MSWIRSFTVGCSKTINLGNFQSLRVEAQVIVDVPEGETPDGYAEMTIKAEEELHRLLELTWRKQHKTGSYE